MDTQLTVRLPRELSAALKETAARMQRKPSEVVRMAVAEFLEIADRPKERPAERVRDLIGSLQSGVPDLASRHREHLLSKLRRGR
jgi:Arc/MetJ-type ribon-helix-helix transcriptional regulator